MSTILFRCILPAVVVTVAGILAGLPGGRLAHGQEQANGSPRGTEKVRALITDLTAHAERERSQLQMTEASLQRARALLVVLKNGQAINPLSSSHSLAIDARHRTVFGNEAYGRYIELLDLSTGRTIGNWLVSNPRFR